MQLNATIVIMGKYLIRYALIVACVILGTLGSAGTTLAHCGASRVDADLIEVYDLFSNDEGVIALIPAARRIYTGGMIRIHWLSPAVPCNGPDCERQSQTSNHATGSVVLSGPTITEFVVRTSSSLSFQMPIIDWLSIGNDSAIGSEPVGLLRPPQA